MAPTRLPIVFLATLEFRGRHGKMVHISCVSLLQARKKQSLALACPGIRPQRSHAHVVGFE